MKGMIIAFIVICALNLADFILTIHGLRSGVGQEINPVMQAGGTALLKLILVPVFAGITHLAAAQAEKERARKTLKIIKAIMVGVLVFLAFVVFQNICVLIFHGGPVDWILNRGQPAAQDPGVARFPGPDPAPDNTTLPGPQIPQPGPPASENDTDPGFSWFPGGS